MSDNDEMSEVQPWKYQTYFNWAVGVLFLGTIIVLAINIASPTTIPGFSKAVDKLITTQLLPVNSTIASNAAKLPSLWTSITPTVIVQRPVDSVQTTISTMVLNTIVNRISSVTYRRTGNHVELYYYLDLIQNNNASTSFAVTAFRVVLSLPVSLATTQLSQCIPGSTNYTILGHTDKITVITPKKILTLTNDAFKTNSTTEVDKIYFDVLIPEYSLYSVQLSGSILYSAPIV